MKLKPSNTDMNNRNTAGVIIQLATNEIFVFGSNLSGLHAGGAARFAYERFGAMWGKGNGIQGKSYAIPTMAEGIERPLTLEEMRPYIEEFIVFAKNTPECRFMVTPIGCGIAGFKPADIAPLFANAIHVENIWLPGEFWAELINEETHQNLS